MASFHTFFEGNVTGFEITCIQSFLDYGHDVKIYTYDKLGFPAHFDLVDASNIIPRKDAFFLAPDESRLVATFSDHFRYCLLAESDKTWWIDTDVVCLSKSWPANEGIVGAAWQDKSAICNAVLYFDRHSALLILENARMLSRHGPWGLSGPTLLTAFLTHNKLENLILESNSFYPIHYSDWYKIHMCNCRSHVEGMCENSFAVHLWNEMARQNDFDKSILPDERSFMGSIVVKHKTEKYFKML